MRRICRIYLSLNFQEHPDFFAAKTNEFWSTFLELLKYENPLLVDADDEEVPGVLDRVKAAIGDIACLFAEKYEEDFRAFVAPFVTQVRVSQLDRLGEFSQTHPLLRIKTFCHLLISPISALFL